MKRAIAVAGAMAIALCAASLYAQGKDFSGKWTVDAEKTAAANPAPAAGARGGGRGGGGPMTIVMDAKTMKITTTNQAGDTTRTYNLDGTESKNTMNMGGNPMDQISTASWTGAKLVITTKGMNGAGDSTATYSLDVANLKVENTRPGAQGGAATTRTTIYTKG
jgi:hypothetical protein